MTWLLSSLPSVFFLSLWDLTCNWNWKMFLPFHLVFKCISQSHTPTSCTLSQPSGMNCTQEYLRSYLRSLPQSCSYTYDMKRAWKLPLERQRFIMFCLCNCYISLNLLVYHLASLPSAITFSPCLVRQGIELVPRQAGLFLRDEPRQTANAAV